MKVGSSGAAGRRVAKASLVAIVAAFASACTAGSVVAAPSDDAELVLGQTIYANQCASCHRSDGSGGRGPALNEGQVVARFPDPADQAALIANGKGLMPAYSARLSAEQLDAVVRYTREVLGGAAEGE